MLDIQHFGYIFDARDTIARLNKTIQRNQNSGDGTTYVRWGRDTAYQVYTRYAAGSNYGHSGTASDTLCLSKNPIYNKYTPGLQGGIIYGAQYETGRPNSAWKHLKDQDILCAVCRITRNNVLMVSGRNTCQENYQLEYKGYLMSRHYQHSASLFICIDNEPEVLQGGSFDDNGKSFYFVDGTCGSLKCPP
ncbi:uncharacterized protein LOC132740674 [Ruditapes philippinarum]|uniref:uncharacterized protein LOC132740674 n=1 Tax=Ruditapes philippinarum TaxID=129788 RepID=UPI00295AE281|nr:uncharacterized protein LOC132740674 [Ruditapes philippinarum]